MTSVSTHSTRSTCSIAFRKASSSATVEQMTHVISLLEHPFIFGANESRRQAGRYSYFCATPLQIFEFHAPEDEPFKKLQAVLDQYKLKKNQPANLPKGVFVGGWAGFFSYELGRYIEKIPQTVTDDIPLPLIRLCFYDRVICYDHLEKQWYLFALRIDADDPQAKLDQLAEYLAKANDTSVPRCEAVELESPDLSKFACNMNQSCYFDALAKIKQYIYDGQVYQINFSQRFESDYTTTPVSLFNWQNRFNPSPYAAYIDAGDFAIVSASPEMFVTIDHGMIRTRPIKGTRARLEESNEANIRTNRNNIETLLASEKEKAELNMIIDLERNDLGRICQYGTIHVTGPRRIESYPTVYHALAEIEGQLRSEITFCDTLKAMFPGGSITGAPKVAAMEIIDETEPTARSVYTGSIGYLGIDGMACLNIAIRTIIIAAGKAYAQTGGGIVADSNADLEWDETLVKARALLAGIESVNKNAKGVSQ